MIRIGGQPLSLDEIEKVLYEKHPIELDSGALQKVRDSYDFLEKFSRNKVIYGINTGFGPMAQYKIEDGDQVQLQYNLIRSHSSGSGTPIPFLHAKATMVARLNTLMKGHSGVNEEVVQTLCQLINQDIVPVIPEHGGVGASGDLVQLAHLGLMLIGEGDVLYKGEERSTAEIFKEKGITPIPIKIREGLALINGTSAMTGIGMINISRAKRALDWSVLFSSMINEVVESYDDHFSKELNVVKLHRGQQDIAKRMRGVLEDSKMIKRRAEHLYEVEVEEDIMDDKVQEYYSLRCVPQILGPILDTLHHTEEMLTNEVNSVNDNPVIDHENNNVYHGGNFHGDQVSIEMDKLKMGLTKLSMLSERQLNYLLNDKLNEKFPPFLNRGKLGFNFGLQGMQYTATSTVAENQTMAYPMYLHSIPNNNDNQDIVSMGSNSAKITSKVIENTFEVLAVTATAVLQAVDIQGSEEKMSTVTRKAHEDLRKLTQGFELDEERSSELEKVRQYLRSQDPLMELE